MSRALLPATLLLLLCAAPAPAMPPAGGGLLTVAARERAETLDEAVARIRRETGGRILRAETVTRNGERVHRIKVLLPDGRVKIYTVKAK